MHYTISKSDPAVDSYTDGVRYVVGHDIGGGWTRHIVQLDKGDTADNPASTKGPIHGPGLVVYDRHHTGITVHEYDNADGFYADVVKNAKARDEMMARRES